jgi:GTP-binding protein
MFVDRLEIYVEGGRGGHGCVSFRREKYVPFGGPDGGDGGDGGSVIVRAVDRYTNLAHLAGRKFWRASNGKNGSGANRHGANGQDLILEVPPGTIVRDRDRGHVLTDLSRCGDQVTVARGGRGGRGNQAFATPTNQAPREYERGKAGEARWIILELKLIADVGFIGMPNAGKSTLLSRISRARPKIADYPFTTTYPHLGIVSLGDGRSLTVADIPGLIEGAHRGAGLGHDFLRHIERTRLLVHLVEIQPSDGSDPADNYRRVRTELELFDPSLPQRSELVALTKADLVPDPEPYIQRLSVAIGQPVLAISSVTGQGIGELVRRMFEMVGCSAEPKEARPT